MNNNNKLKVNSLNLIFLNGRTSEHCPRYEELQGERGEIYRLK